jgi:hypothetical protein
MPSTRAAAARAWLAAGLLTVLAPGCDERGAPGTPAAELALAETPRAFELRGAPGPWWRDGATQPDFDSASRSCLARSGEIRRRTAPDGRADAAYRAFLECMQQDGWRRGLRPLRADLIPPAR